MGLSGRKVKQRIGPDPRNLAWADDASKFGANYLAKFGWDPSKGLGVEGQGRTSHIKVSQKLDMLGIGAAQSKDPNGIAWKQNKDFESLLRRLNESTPDSAGQSDTGDVEDGEGAGVSHDVAMEKEEKEESKEDRKRRKREEKQAKKEKKEKKKRKRDEEKEEQEEEEMKGHETKAKKIKAEAEAEKVEVPKRVIPRGRAHRARAIAAKNMSSKSAAHISEILGIASSSSSSVAPTAPQTPSGSLTPIDADVGGLEKLTTSTKSVSDYFKEKMLAKTYAQSLPLSSMVTQKADVIDEDEYEDVPRGGIGSFRNSARGEYDLDDADRGGLGSARAATTAMSTMQSGMSKFQAMFTSAAIMPEIDSVKTGSIADTEGIVKDAEAREGKKKRKDGKHKEKNWTEIAGAAGESDTGQAEGERGCEEEEQKREKAEKKRRRKEQKGSVTTL
ncbi:hypothetical protein C8R42DRAFT_694485 [Lentinula raphanica]|nr:hypothetical protein C8R42DRAFT_694485 [Lentinula raphanica]